MPVVRALFFGYLGFCACLLQAANVPGCPAGTRQVVRREKTATVYTCGRPVSLCPDSEKLEFVTETIRGKTQCYIAHGTVLYNNRDGSSLLMTYANGILDGNVLAVNSEGNKTLEETYIGGAKEGKRTLYHQTGHKRLQENYVRGVRTGVVNGYYPSGKLHRKFTFKEGKRDGIYTEWYENGNRKMESHYTAGIWNGPYQEWYSNGKLYSDGLFKSGIVEGKYTLYYRNGKKMSQREYSAGRISGKFQEWDETGMREAESDYIDGKFSNYTYQSARALMLQNSRRQIARNALLSTCASMAGIGFSPDVVEKSQGCLKADFDGNGYLDNIISLPEDAKKSKAVLLKRDVVYREEIIAEPSLEIYSARPTEGQFDEPASPRDGLVAWGKGGDTHVYLYDYDAEVFVKSVHGSDAY